jgi:hypothetical protein
MTPLYSDVQREVNHLEQAFQPNLIGVAAWRVDLETNRQRMAAYAATADYRPYGTTRTPSASFT